nr:BPK_HP1_G0043570.mRNA.1.CDS.1 [Saccharomyces cerevisiae]
MTLLRQNKPLQKWFVSYVEKANIKENPNLAQKVSVLSPSLKLVGCWKSISADQSNLSKLLIRFPTLPDLKGNLIRLHGVSSKRRRL